MIELEKEFCCACGGMPVWHKIKKKYNLTDRFGLVIFPMADFNINCVAVKLLPDYIERMFLQNAVAVTDQEEGVRLLREIECEKVFCESVSHEEMRQLLRYYRLVQFCTHIIVISLEIPFGNDTFLRNSGINLHSYISSAIYKMR